jgi:hypothetical protein
MTPWGSAVKRTTLRRSCGRARMVLHVGDRLLTRGGSPLGIHSQIRASFCLAATASHASRTAASPTSKASRPISGLRRKSASENHAAGHRAARRRCSTQVCSHVSALRSPVYAPQSSVSSGRPRARNTDLSASTWKSRASSPGVADHLNQKFVRSCTVTVIAGTTTADS